MSHHPTTAELAAFRRSIIGDLDTWKAAFAAYPPIHRNGEDGAWSWERERGIGYRETDCICAVAVRREASALRSRAYERAYFEAVGTETFGDLLAAVETFAPFVPGHALA